MDWDFVVEAISHVGGFILLCVGLMLVFQFFSLFQC